MYDKKNEAREFVGESRDDALADAKRFFGVELDEMRVSDLDLNEIHGLAGRTVVVAAPSNSPRVTSGGGDDGGDRGRRERPARRERGGGGGGGGGGRERGGRDRERGGRGRSQGREDSDRRPRQQEVAADSTGTARGELGEVGKVLLGTVERMGLGTFEIEESMDGDLLIFQLDGDAALKLGSGDGRGVDALQLVANQASLRIGEDSPRVIVDAAGSSEKRESFLGRLAERAASRSIESKRSVALDPMNPKDRRIIHVALRDIDGVATMSTGAGQYRQVVVVPEGSPEFEDARRSSEEAGSRD